MQTFLPYPSFTESAQTLDNLRLRKQFIEANQIIDVLEDKTTAWKNHPAVLMWKGYVDLLKYYRDVVLEENKNRGFMIEYDYMISSPLITPKWLGLKDFHFSHQSKLLWKGRVDAICAAIKFHYKVFSINSWLKEHNYSQKNVLTREEVIDLEETAGVLGLKIPENYYKKFNFEVGDGLAYYWPTKNGY